MDKSIIDLNVNNAIRVINETYDFNRGKEYIIKALTEVGSYKKLEYYETLMNVIVNLHYKVRGFSKKFKVKDCYNALLDFYQKQFEGIVGVSIDPDSIEEMNRCNAICCGIINSAISFSTSMRKFYFDIGLITTIINNKLFIDKYMPIILKIEKSGRDILSKYNNRSAIVNKNIKTWDDEVKGKYGRKYL